MPIDRITQLDNVERLHPNFEVEVQSAESEGGTSDSASTGGPTIESDTYDTTAGLDLINAPEAWEKYDTRGETARVAALDTGVEAAHDDIELHTTDSDDPTYPGGWAEFDSYGNQIEGSEPHDTGWHGTHVTGTVAGGDASGYYIGVAPDTELQHGLVLPDGGGSFSQIIGGMEWAVETDTDVISMSLGVDGYSTAFIDPIRSAEQQGVMVVASIGNSEEGTSSSPGNEYDSVGVGATTSSGEVATFSGGELIDTDSAWGSEAPNDWPDEYVVPSVAAQGQVVYSAEPGNDYRAASGTSMAAPHVAGAVALIQSATAEQKSPEEIKVALQATAWKPEGWDEADAEHSMETEYGTTDTRYGHGIIDVPAAIEYLIEDGDDDPEPDTEVIDAELADSAILEGETVTVTADVENTGDADGEHEATLYADGEVRDSTTVEVAAGETERVTFEERFDHAGSYGIDVDDRHAGTLTVEEATPAFQVTEATLQEETILEGETAAVDATVENTGDATGEFTAEFTLSDEEGATAVLDSETVTLDPGETASVLLSGTVDAAGSYDAAVSDEPAGTLTVEAPARFDLSEGALSEPEIETGESVTVTGTVTNSGDREGTFEAELHIDGRTTDTLGITVAAGASEPIQFSPTFETAGEYGIAIEGDDGDGARTATTAGTLTVLSPAEFQVTDPTLEDTSVLEGETTGVTATVENVGDVEGTVTIELAADDGTGPTVHNETDLTLAGGESSEERLEATVETAGEYDITIGGEYAGTLTVEEPSPAAFETSEVVLSEETILAGEETTISATVENVGDESGEHTAVLTVDGEQRATETRTIDGGESVTVSFTESFATAGEYDVAVDDAAPATLTVEQDATIEVVDAALSETTILEGETVAVDATVENTGDRDGTVDVALVVDEEVRQTQSVAVQAGVTQSITFEESFDDPGTYEIAVDDTTAGTLTVEEATAEFVVTEAALTDDTILAGTTASATATVENTGDAAGEFTAEFTLTDDSLETTVRDTKTVTLDPGETTSVTLADVVDTAGTYSAAVSGDAAGQLTVEQPATFDVTEATLSEETILEGESVTTSATVENTGDREGTFTAELTVDGTVVGTQDVTVASDDTATVTFEELFTDAGEYEIGVSGTPAGTLTVEETTAEFEVTNAALDDSTILEGENATVVADVENVGTESGTYSAEFVIDGEVRTQETITLAPGESERVRLAHTVDTAGEYETAVGQVATGTLTVEQPAELIVTDATLQDETILEGDQAVVETTIENVGDRDGERTVDLMVDGTVEASATVTVAAGESETVTLSEQFADAGTYELAVEAEPAGTLTVEAAAALDVIDADLSQSRALEGDAVTVTGTVENTGDRERTIEAELLVDGAVLETRDVTVAGGETTQVSFEQSFDDRGEYAIAVNDEPAGTLTVQAPASLAVLDTTLEDDRIFTGEHTTVTTTVENTGDREGTRRLGLELDGDVVVTRDVTVAGGETTQVSLEQSVEDPGEYEVAVNTTAAGTLTVEQHETGFSVPNPRLADPVVPDGRTTNVSTIVENNGVESHEGTITVAVNGEVVESRSLTLGSGETETVTVPIDTAELDLGPGEHTVTVTIDDEEATITLLAEHSVATYADDNGTVETSDLRDGIRDWQSGEIGVGLLIEVISAWQSG